MAPYRQHRLSRISEVLDISSAHKFAPSSDITLDRTRRGDACIITMSDIRVDNIWGEDMATAIHAERVALVPPVGDKA